MSGHVLQTIAAKRDREELSADAIAELINAYAKDRLPDYQMSAFAMAVLLNGMTFAEVAALTDAMLHSGDVLEWSAGSAVVDKHSTGGIGDKVSLILAPMLAACGLRVPMISGRGLGPTGGTLDKLEAIPGFRTDLFVDEIQRTVQDVGCVITGAGDRIAPADRKLYALRDVTATVPSIPLVTASIMSKKLAEGLSALVLDVKVGSGAFMKTMDDARALAKSLCEIGQRLNVETRFVISDMNQPLGRMIGNAVEVHESIAALNGNAPDDLMLVTEQLGAELLLAAGVSPDFDSAKQQLQATIQSGDAMAKFEEMVRVQAGDLSALPPIGPSTELLCEQSGFVASIETEQLGWTIVELGGGRKLLTDQLDHGTGLEMLVRVGDAVEARQPWVRLFEPQDRDCTDRAMSMLSNAITITDHPVEPLKVLIESGT